MYVVALTYTAASGRELRTVHGPFADQPLAETFGTAVKSLGLSSITSIGISPLEPPT